MVFFNDKNLCLKRYACKARLCVVGTNIAFRLGMFKTFNINFNT